VLGAGEPLLLLLGLGRRAKRLRRGLEAIFHGGEQEPLSLVHDARDHLPEVGLGFVELLPRARAPNPLDDAPALQLGERHADSAARHREVLPDIARGERVAREVKNRPQPAERLAEPPMLDHVADRVGSQELGFGGSQRGGRGKNGAVRGHGARSFKNF
jgi:hypothetical protein